MKKYQVSVYFTGRDKQEKQFACFELFAFDELTASFAAGAALQFSSCFIAPEIKLDALKNARIVVIHI